MGQRRKHVTQSAVAQDVQPPQDNQHIVRALGSRGGNIVEVQYPDGATTLCIMPAKFNRNLWVRRGGYLIVECSTEAEQDKSSRVTGTICSVLYDEHIKQLKKMPGVWPVEFAPAQPAALTGQDEAALPSTSSSSDEQEQEQNGQEARVALDGLQLGSTDQQQCVNHQQPPASSSQDDEDRQGGTRQQTAAAAAEVMAATTSGSQAVGDDEGSESDDGLPPLQQIHNRRVIHHVLSSDSGSDCESDEQ